MPPVESGAERFDLLVTPQFYLMKKEKLPVRFSFQARRIAPAMMEEVGAGSDWAYEVYRRGDEWVVIAYNPDEIVAALQKAGLSPERIGRLYFAQQFIDDLVNPLRLNDRQVLTVMDEMATILPMALIENEIQQWSTLKELHRPSHGFSLQGISNRGKLGSRETLVITLLLMFLAGAWFLEGIRYHRSASAFVERLQRATEKNPALASRITRQNIHTRYLTLDQRQRGIRMTLRRIGTLISKDSKLSHLKVDESGYEAVIESRPAKISTLKKLALSAGLPAKTDGSRLIVKGAWQ